MWVWFFFLGQWAWLGALLCWLASLGLLLLLTVDVVGCAAALVGFWGLGALPRWLAQLLSVVFGFASRRVTFFASAKKVTKESRPDTAVPLRVTTLRCSRQRGAAELARKKTLAQTVLAHSPL